MTYILPANGSTTPPLYCSIEKIAFAVLLIFYEQKQQNKTFWGYQTHQNWKRCEIRYGGVTRPLLDCPGKPTPNKKIQAWRHRRPPKKVTVDHDRSTDPVRRRRRRRSNGIAWAAPAPSQAEDKTADTEKKSRNKSRSPGALDPWWVRRPGPDSVLGNPRGFLRSTTTMAEGILDFLNILMPLPLHYLKYRNGTLLYLIVLKIKKTILVHFSTFLEWKLPLSLPLPQNIFYSLKHCLYSFDVNKSFRMVVAHCWFQYCNLTYCYRNTRFHSYSIAQNTKEA